MSLRVISHSEIVSRRHEQQFSIHFLSENTRTDDKQINN